MSGNSILGKGKMNNKKTRSIILMLFMLITIGCQSSVLSASEVDSELSEVSQKENNSEVDSIKESEGMQLETASNVKLEIESNQTNTSTKQIDDESKVEVNAQNTIRNTKRYCVTEIECSYNFTDEYGSNGSRAVTKGYDPKTNKLMIKIIYEGDTPDPSKLLDVTRYNLKGQTIQHTMYLKENDIIEDRTYTYYSNGNYKQIIAVGNDGEKISDTKYNEQGLHVDEIEYCTNGKIYLDNDYYANGEIKTRKRYHCVGGYIVQYSEFETNGDDKIRDIV